MLIKLERKSNRVKGLAFHPKHPWVLASLHNGTIQLVDYRVDMLIHKYEDHEGPVRGVAFHNTQPQFVSGGDDYKIKVWDYQTHKVVSTLQGHLDYIRTVQFHHENPWVLSASDDQTVRIWNWISRQCISMMTGHNHYVMCARFHPSEDLVVSASLDQTIRVWDIAGLKHKGSMGRGGPMANMGPMGASADVFGSTDVTVKYVLEGHDRGVNWADFHPKSPHIVSGADDRLVKLWRYSDTKAWEVDSLRGHTSNVSCVAFHPTQELIISDSEDRTIKIWDAQNRKQLHTFRSTDDRYWVIATHPTNSLIAAGHDNGLIVFKLDRQRPNFHCHADKQNFRFFYLKDRQMVMWRGSQGGDILGYCRKQSDAMKSGIRSLQYNTYSNSDISLLIQYDGDQGSYDLFSMPLDGPPGGQAPEPRRGSATHTAFVARNRFATLAAGRNSICIYNFNNEVIKEITGLPCTPVALFPGGNNRLLIQGSGEDKIYMYDVLTKKVLYELLLPGGIRYVIWSPSYSHAAILGKRYLTLVDKNLNYLCTSQEYLRVKSGAWDENGVFIYSTPSHIKYLLQNGDGGIIQAIDNAIYIAAVAKGKMFYMNPVNGGGADDANEPIKRDLNCHEYLFKLALLERNFQDVEKHIREGGICGSVVIGYLKKKGYPEVALHFVDDQKTRFNLALDFGHIEQATDAAKQVEMAYQMTRDFDALSFLYLITGNRQRLQKIMKIAQTKRQDSMKNMAIFTNSLMLGSIEDRVDCLANIGSVSVAALLAKTYGLKEKSDQLEEALNKDVSGAIPADAKCFLPPMPVLQGNKEPNWPLLQTTAKIFEDHLANAAVQAQNAPQAPMFADDDSIELAGADSKPAVGNTADDWDDLDGDDGGEAWGDDLDDLGELPSALSPQSKPVADIGANETGPGPTAQSRWLKTRSLPCDFVAAGEFKMALDLLKRRIALADPKPLQPLFEKAFMAAQTSLPDFITDMLKTGNQLTTKGKFNESLAVFREVLQAMTLAAARDNDEDNQLREYIGMCREYVTAMRMETTRKALPAGEVKRSVELSSYMTLCKLVQSHQLLCCRVAMTLAFKAQNFVTASVHAKRLLTNPKRSPEIETKAKQVLRACEQKGTDAIKLQYFDQRLVDNFQADEGVSRICARDFVPIDKATAKECPFCGSSYQEKYAGTICDNCGLSKIGENCLGMQFQAI